MEKEIIGKNALIDKVAAITDGITKKDIGTVIANVFKTITEEARKGSDIRIMNFGTFKKNHRNARKGHNPQTGAEIEIPACDVLAFKSNIKF